MADSDATRPAYRKRASVNAMKEIIRSVLDKELTGATYSLDNASASTKKIADIIRAKLKALDLPRYKFMTQVVVGEQRGEGVRMGCRTFWDTDTDSYASETFVNDHIFCVATAYAVYLS